MTKKLKLLLLMLLSVAAVVCTAVGCSIGTQDLDEILEDYSGGHVTYYGNGGKFEGMSVGVREIYYKQDNVPFFDIEEASTDSTQTTTGNVTIAYEGFDFGGWFEVAKYTSGDHAGELMFTYTDESGTEYPVYIVEGEEDSEARPYYSREGKNEKISESEVVAVASDTEVTSSRIISSGETLAVCAVWTTSLKIEYRLLLDDKTAVYKDKDGKEYKDGDLLDSTVFGRGDTATPGTRSRKTLIGATFLRSYADKECTQEIGVVTRPTDGENVVVWCKYIDGTWTVISASKPADVQTMLLNLTESDNKYYILDDVDCSSVTTFTLKYTTSKVMATVQGNGHTISNINISTTIDATVTAEAFGALFGTFGSSANISDLKIDNVSITISARKQWLGAAISYGIADGAKITGLEISNITMSIPESKYYGSETNWLFGQNTTDEGFLSANTGIKVSGDNKLILT